MERLTSSQHVINLFGFCGHSVLTEFADGSRVGELADKARKRPLARLKIASDIAHGLADVHGIDGDGNATFVHLDVNPANVVSIGGTLKLNDFNIGIIRRWNTTSNTPCGFPAQYPNPQVRLLLLAFADGNHFRLALTYLHISRLFENSGVLQRKLEMSKISPKKLMSFQWAISSSA